MTTKKKKQRYKSVGGKRWIEVRIKSPLQLFDVRDPSPFRERDLDDDFVEYIISSSEEFSLATLLKIVIYIEEKESKDLPREFISEAFRSYFYYQIELQRSHLRRFIRRAQVFLLIGSIILISCLAVSQKLTSFEALGELPVVISILREGIVIFGWVSVWKPIELILFDWYPIFERMRLYKKLLATELEIRFATE